MNAPRVDFPPFEANPLLSHPSVMTLFGTFSRRRAESIVRRAESRIVRVDETTSVRVEIDRPMAPARAAIVILHGLVGSSESVYVLGTAEKAVGRGFLVARLNARNCGGTEELTSTAYNGGQTAELEAIARELVERDGVERVHLIGFSVGANQALRLAARMGEEVPLWLASITAISPCIDFDASASILERGFFQRFVQRRLLEGLKEIIRRRHELDPSTVSIEGLDRIRTLRAFDERYTAPLSGYRNASDYYDRVSTWPHLGEIAVPTLLLIARDDPLVPFDCFERLTLGAAPIQLVVTPRGGHVAFIGRRAAKSAAWNDTDRRWAENRAVQFAAAHNGR